MIIYFSSTGNSRFIAEYIARKTDDKLLDIMSRHLDAHLSRIDKDESLGMVFPVYGWNLPPIVETRIHYLFGRKLYCKSQKRYVWVVLTCGDDTGFIDTRLKATLRAVGLEVNALFSVTMPNTYVCLPGFDVDTSQIISRKLSACTHRADEICEHIKNRDVVTNIHRGKFPYFKTYVLGTLFRRFLLSDKPFHTTADCTHCGLCQRICPLHNIIVSKDALPYWLGHCTGCLRCYHYCPVRAIRFGKYTENKGQYLWRAYR